MIIANELLERILLKKNTLDAFRPFPKAALARLRENFIVDATYNSNAIEGNTLNKSETKLVLEEGITIGGKSMREHFEAVNHKEALSFVENIVTKKQPITKEILCYLNKIILTNIEDEEKGIYRLRRVHIAGASIIPPMPSLVPSLMEKFLRWLNYEKESMVDFVALSHEKFLSIHPFIDGNGRVGRLLMSLILMQQGYPPIVILKTERAKYIKTLDNAHKENSTPFVNFIGRNIERSLMLWIDALQLPGKDSDKELIPLSEAAKDSPYSQEYLSLLARKGILESVKKNRNWLTTKRAVQKYREEHKQ